MSNFIKIANKKDIKANSMKTFVVNGQKLLVANLNGSFYAISNICTHEEGVLSEGQLVNDCCVECPLHGASFDLKTGAVKALPATEAVKTYEVRVDGEDLLIPC
ncbi:MAG: non-heme iron oxygenase ferredoxin subunit [Patescibacteria group bacterium]